MKPIIALIALATLIAAPLAQAQFPPLPPPEIAISGTPDSHDVTFQTERGFIYQLLVAPNLYNWLATGIEEGGTGLPLTYHFSSPASQLFYRTYRTNNVNKFLLLPRSDFGVPYQKSAGVPFHFYLDVFPQLPARIDIFRRVGNGPGTLIGRITDFADIAGIKFVRGPVVWVPDQVGEYEITVTAFDAADNIIASDVGEATIIPDIPPTVLIFGGPAQPTTTDPQPIEFNTEVSDDVVRVDFFDNGMLIGSDTRAPFGTADASNPIDSPPDSPKPDGTALRTREGAWVNPWFRKGTHSITAKAYNKRGISGVTASSYDFAITDGNARPVVNISYPTSLVTVEQGTPVTVTYTVTDADNDVIHVGAGFIPPPGGFSAPTPGAPITINTSGLSFGTHTFRVVAADGSFMNESFPQYITIRVVPAGGATFDPELVTTIADPAMSHQPFGVVYTGTHQATGLFTGGVGSGLEFDEGIVMTTGLFASWNGNDAVEDRERLYGILGDITVQDYIGAPLTKDGAVIEFDVTAPAGHGQLEMEVQFGSEEYIEYVGKDGFNDAFLVTVDGVAISLLPDASDIIAVTTIHPNIDASESSVLGPMETLPSINEYLYLDDSEITAPTSGQKVEYDGMTIRLRLHALITPLQTHKVRISITDMKDSRYDSALFIKTGSLRTVPLPTSP